MTYKVETLPAVDKTIGKLDKAAREAVIDFLKNKLPRYEDPRAIGKALQGPDFGEFWRYEVYGFRIIVKIEDKRLLIVVVRIGDRKNVYKKR